MPFQFSLFRGSSGTGSWHVSFGQTVHSIKREVQFHPSSDTTADNGGFTFPMNHCKVHKRAAYPFPAVTFSSCPLSSWAQDPSSDQGPWGSICPWPHRNVIGTALVTPPWAFYLSGLKDDNTCKSFSFFWDYQRYLFFFLNSICTLTSKNPSRFDHHLQLFIPCESPDIIFK